MLTPARAWSASSYGTGDAMKDVLIFLLAVVVGYFVGSISPATLIARARGVDLRSEGSGNPGATNASRIMGRKVGIVVAVADVLKGLVPTLVFAWLFWPEVGLVAGLAAVIGHVTSPFLRGKGGRGVATAVGAVIAGTPAASLVVLATFAVVVALSRWVALASMTSVVALVVAVVVMDYGWAYVVWAVSLAAIVLWRHRSHARAAYLRARRRLGRD